MPIAALFFALVFWGLVLGSTAIGILMVCVPRFRHFSPYLIFIPIVGVVGGIIGLFIGSPLAAAFSADARASGFLIGCVGGTLLGSLIGFWLALPNRHE